MIKLIKRYRKRNDNGGYDFNEVEVLDVMYAHKENQSHDDIYNLFKTKLVLPDRTNGRYMIKKQSLKHAGLSYNYVAYRKTYFNQADKGISFAVNDRKNPNIFYTNNWIIACRLAKMLSANSFGLSELVSIVDRKKSGKETYVLNKTQQRGMFKIFVK